MGNLLASVGFNRVMEASVSIFGTNEANPIKGSIIPPILVRLHLRKWKTVPRSSNSSGQTSLLSYSSESAVKVHIRLSIASFLGFVVHAEK